MRVYLFRHSCEGRNPIVGSGFRRPEAGGRRPRVVGTYEVMYTQFIELMYKAKCTKRLTLCFFFNHSLDLDNERWQFNGHRFPDKVVVDVKVAVNEAIAHIGHLPPGNPRVFVA